MEEKIGKRINVERTDEALTTDADLISTACPFCIVMLSDAVTAKVQEGTAKEGVQVLDVSQILARSLKAPALVGADATQGAAPVAGSAGATAGADQGQLAQAGGTPDATTVSDPASSGATLSDAPGDASGMGTGTPGEAPGGATENQGSGPPERPER